MILESLLLTTVVVSSKPWWMFILATVINGGVLTALFNWYRWHKTKKCSKTIMQALHSMDVVYRTLKRVLHNKDNPVGRAVIFAGHNCGGIPVAGKPFYISSLYWQADTEERTNAIRDYKNISVDSDYASMLVKLITDGVIVYDTKTMTDSMLKRYHKVEGIRYSVSFMLGILENQVLYASFSSYDRKFSDSDLVELELQVNVIKNELNLK